MQPPISLCVIAGNVERYIERFIASFRPLVDEIIIVRAIGSQTADDTMRLAEAANCRTAIYEQTGDLPHVDDFAAARNQAFSLASHEWVMWADTDDILTPDSIPLIREALATHAAGVDGFAFNYSVPGDGVTVLKERLMRKGAGAWRYRIHEEFRFHNDSPVLKRIPGALIEHLPAGSRKPNDQRNLTLLRAMQRDGEITIGHRFHLVQSLRTLGHLDQALKEATDLLAESSLGKPERYELLMNLAEVCPDEATQGNIYLQAHGVDPSRREALGELAIWCLRQCRFPEMLAWTTMMTSLPRHRGYLWNTRAMYYSWLGIRLHCMALRLNGDSVRADTLMQNYHKQHGAKISLLHATRGRPRLAIEALHKWLKTAKHPDTIEHIFAIDADDESSKALAAHYSVTVPAGGGCVRAWNAAAAKSQGHVLIQVSDDWDPPVNWDEQILTRLGDLTQPKVLAISDGHRTDKLLCMAILTRARYEQQGYFFHPDFLSVYSDDWFTHCAYRDGVVIEARDFVIEHQHPLFTGAPVDQTTAESNTAARYAQGKSVFDRLLATELPSPIL